jgi:hypothetical protein
MQPFKQVCERGLLLALLLAGFLTFALPPVLAAPLPTPSQPILVVQGGSSANLYQNFIPEILTTEGLNGFQVAQLGDLTSTFLANYDVVILPHLPLTSAQATLFRHYVNSGGTLVGLRPDPQLADVFGVASLGTSLQESWLKMDTTTPYAPSSDSEAMRFHGAADLYSLSGASALATLYNSTTSPTASPAAAIYTYGLGKAILFSFDLAQSIVLMRQGNPAWAGYPNTHDGFNTMRASQMFMDEGSGQFWNDLGDGTLNDVPQADIQMRLFSNLVTLTNAAKRPLPKFWYYPNQSRAMLLMTGDDHSFPVPDALGEINNIASYGGLFSYNLWYPFTTVSSSQVSAWLGAGYTMGIHFNDTAEVDSSGVGGSAASWNGMQSVMSTALSSFKTTYPTAPYPVTTRNHFLIWVSNDSDGAADQVAQAKLFQSNGIQLDTSIAAFPKRWGYMTGSGLPMKFLDPVAGTVIPVYEQATQYEDDIQLLPGEAYGLNWDFPTANSHYQQTLSDSLTKYNTVTTMLFHPENWSGYQSYADVALQYAQSQSIPMSTTGNWLNFWKARAATTVSMPSFASGTLTFTTTDSPAGLTLLVPFASDNSRAVASFQVDGVSQSFMVAAYQGVNYASVVLTAPGTHAISVTYSPAGKILGQISPGAAAHGTTVQAQSGAITQTVDVASNGSYALGPLPAGTYTVTPVSSNYVFSPISRSVTLGTANVPNINFNGTLIPGETLFTSQTPALSNQSDGPEANYELGTAFTSDVAGQITGIRFWKAPSENGTHTGNIWSGAGLLLASVTFSNETASGWQKQALPSPLAIAANTKYLVSVNTANTFYVASVGGLSSQVSNLDLSSIVGGNGVYATTPAQFPTNSFENMNYFRDVFFVPSNSVADKLPPVTTATPLPMPNQNGWNHTEVLLSFSAQDNPGGSGVKDIQFSLSGAQNAVMRTVPGNFATTFISGEGTTVVTYFATDRDGNREAPKTLAIRIDEKPPLIFGMPSPGCALRPPDHQLMSVAVVFAMDPLSGLSRGSFKVAATSNQPSGKTEPDVVITPLGDRAFRVLLRAEHSNLEERIYTITATATDLAGNSTSKTSTCVVPRDSGGEVTKEHDHESDFHGHDN